MKKLLFIVAGISTVLFLQNCNSTNAPSTYQVTISANPSKGGSVNPSSGKYEGGTKLEITATPSEGWLFEQWEGDYQGINSTSSITVNKDMSIQARFVEKNYSLTIEVVGEGIVEETVVQAKSTDYEQGTKVQLTAIPANGWRFEQWEGDLTGNTNPETITVGEAKTIKAIFVKKEYPLTIEVVGEGTVEETVVQSKSTDYEQGTKVQLTAIPANGWEFIKWEGDLTGNTNPETITIGEAKTVKAIFEVKLHSIVAQVEGQGTVSLIPDKTEFEQGEIVEISAEASEGWYFSHWKGDLTGDENPTTLNVDGQKSFTAVFKITPNTSFVNLPSNGALILFQATNAGSGVAFVSTEEVSFGDGNNGLWRTEDSGQSWEKTADFKVNFITIANNNPNLVFAGHDEGYLLSQDGGKTWENGSIVDERFGNPLALYAAAIVSSNNGIYVATSTALGRGLYKSTNLGQTWQYILTPDDVSDSKDASLEHVVISPENESIVYTSTSFDFNILKSTNGGNSFSSIKNGITIDPFIFSDGILVNPNNSEELLINGHISGDGGVNWSRQDVSPMKNIWIDNTLIKIENGIIYGSEDSGQNWTTVLELVGDSIPSVTNPNMFLSKDALFLKIGNKVYKADLSAISARL